MSEYIDRDKLGSGGFGEVFECVHPDKEGLFAKKVLVVDEPEAVKRFQREVRILSTLDHPRIVKVLAMNLIVPPYWYVMPRYRSSLYNCMSEFTGSDKKITKVISGILEAIQYAHEQGVIHRDLKPENVLLGDDDEVVVTDFGFGRDIDAKTTRATTTGMGFGTFGFIAPEQLANAKTADHRCDIFAIGRLMYELYTGNAPGFTHDLSNLKPGIAAIIDRCTKTDPQRRFQSVAELRSAYSSMLESNATKDTKSRFEELLASITAHGYMTPGEAPELSNLILMLNEDVDLMHETVIKLPEFAFCAIWDSNPIAASVLAKQFSEHVTSQSWGWDYTDVIGKACRRFYNGVRDPEVRAVVVKTLVDVGVDHNRHFVLGIVRVILESIDDFAEGLAVSNSLRDEKRRLSGLKSHLDIARIRDTNIRSLFVD